MGVVSLELRTEDARREKTRERLAAAVLELAREGDITAVSVAELTRRAGTHRSTFYLHADSPTGLLTAVLSQDLDVMRRDAMIDVEKRGLLVRELTHRANREIIRHVLKYEDVYAAANVTSSRFALRVVLAEHVEESARIVLEGGYVDLPDHRPESMALYAAFIAHGVAGAVETWLHTPAPRDEELLLTAIENMYPSWYAPQDPVIEVTEPLFAAGEEPP